MKQKPSALLKKEESEDLFNFSPNEQNHEYNKADRNSTNEIVVKLEKSSPKTKNAIPAINDQPITSLISNSSSVFAIPNETDEIIFLDDTENFMFDTPDLSFNNVSEKCNDNDKSNQIQRRMDNSSAMKKNVDNANMARFECPECAAVSYI